VPAAPKTKLSRRIIGFAIYSRGFLGLILFSSPAPLRPARLAEKSLIMKRCFTASSIAMLAIISASTMACAEPLFFDCHGTFETSSEKGPDPWGPWNLTDQIMIDPDKGVVEAPVVEIGTNDYCAQESDWMQFDTTPLKRKIKECTTLQISETAYTFNTITDYRFKLPNGKEGDNVGELRAYGRLNRITGEFSGEQKAQTRGSEQFRITKYKMTCLPVQRKF
jgi:hypothetical protein